MVITLVADMNKASSGHKAASVAALPLMKHILKKAPSGAHAMVEQDIKTGMYTIEITRDTLGQVQLTFTPGSVP